MRAAADHLTPHQRAGSARHGVGKAWSFRHGGKSRLVHGHQNLRCGRSCLELSRQLFRELASPFGFLKPAETTYCVSGPDFTVIFTAKGSFPTAVKIRILREKRKSGPGFSCPLTRSDMIADEINTAICPEEMPSTSFPDATQRRPSQATT